MKKKVAVALLGSLLPWLVWQEQRSPTSQTLILGRRATFVLPRGRTQTRTVTLDRDTVTGRNSGFFREIRVFSLCFTEVSYGPWRATPKP